MALRSASTPDQVAFAVNGLAERVGAVENELETWGQVHEKILATLEVQSRMLAQIVRAVERQPADDNDPLGDLLRQLVVNGQRHAEALEQLSARIAALGKAAI